MSGDSKPATGSGPSALSLILLFTVWYAFNAGYNVYNAKLKVLPCPLAISATQLVVGMLYAIPLWVLGLRKIPNINFKDFLTILPIAMMNAAGHSCAVIAMFQHGGGSFTHVIKASEPVVSTLMGLVLLGKIPTPLAAISLLPITYGVAYASTLGNLNVATMSKELMTLTAGMAMASNVTFAYRSILKHNLDKEFKTRTNLDAQNEHAVSTLLSFVLTVPFVFIFEGMPKIEQAYQSLKDPQGFLVNIFACGMCFYLYNEMQNLVLGSLGPVPTAVGNTLKRVVIFAALFVFIGPPQETFPLPKVVGCAIAVVGCLAYAIFNAWKM